MISVWVVILLLVLLAVGLWFSSLAGRIDRLHHRIELAAMSLDNQLVRRASATETLATSGLLDPSTSMILAVAALGARGIDPRDFPARESAESELSQDLRLALDDAAEVAALRESPVGAELLSDLGSACRRVELARRFHNDAAVACRQLRRRPVVRVFHLAGSAAWPRTFEMDDGIPAVLRD